jgi:sirohydrochlorin ferrochelatase
MVQQLLRSIDFSTMDIVSMSNGSHETTAVLLIAHGSRRQEANDDLLLLADAVRKRNRYQTVEVSYLEIASPTIPEGARRCIEQGSCRILMLPYFLSAGAHVVNDLKKHQRELASDFPDVSIELCRPLGLHSLLIEVVLQRLDEISNE